MLKKIILSALLLGFSQLSISEPLNNNAILFISLGMPKLVLRQYLLQSQVYGIPLVVRGLIDNSYVKTTKRVYELLHPKNKQAIKSGVEIDPTWFKEFHIKTVPALVLSTHQQNCTVFGNLKIPNLLRVIRNRCHHRSIVILATQYLEKYNE